MQSFFAYIRVSTQKQGLLGVSLQEQRAAIERYAQRHGLSITRWFEERETAAKRGRPIFTEMLKELRRGKTKGLIIHKIDRSARNLKDWADLGELIDTGVEVHFATEALDLHTRGGRLSADIQAVVAADFIRNLREETRKGFYGRLSQGIYPLPAPIGYLDRGAGKPKEPDPITAPLLRACFELYSSGAYNLHTLREEMTRRGLLSSKGRPVSITGLSIMLNNPFYTGLIRIRRTNETFKGAHQPIVSPSLFKRVHDVLTGKVCTRTQKHPFLFRRLLQCAACGYALIGERQKGHVYYRCHTRGCPTTGIREDAIEQVISEQFAAAQLMPQEIDEVRRLVPEVMAEEAAGQEDRVRGMELQLDNLKIRMDRLVDAYVDQAIDKATFEERKVRLLSEQATLEEQLHSLRSGTGRSANHIERLLELAGSLHSAYISALDDDKRDLLTEVTSNRALHGKNLAVTLKSPFAEMAKRADVSSGAPYRYEPRTLASKMIERASSIATQLGC
jgi:DNA invertase Pin-like site-specific DNA recombinase